MYRKQNSAFLQEENLNRRVLIRDTVIMTILSVVIYTFLIVTLRYIHTDMIRQRKNIARSYASVGSVLIREDLELGSTCNTVIANFRHVEKDIVKLGYTYRLYIAKGDSKLSYAAGAVKKMTDPVAQEDSRGDIRWRIEVMPENGWKIGFIFQMFTALGTAISVVLLSVIGTAFRSNRLHRTLQMYASRDPLTNVMSRGAFTLQAESMIRRQPEKPYTYLTLDIDDFKLVNDVYGHESGDRALKALGTRLLEIFQADCLVGRVGGDEFAVLVFGKTAAEARSQIESAQKERFTFLDSRNTEQSFTISIGYADAPAQGKSLDAIREFSDVALYSVKMFGKHGCLYYNPSMGSEARNQLGFSLRNVGENIPGALFVYRADESEEILYANQVMIHLMGCESMSEFLSYTKGSFRGIVQPKDYEKMSGLIREQIENDDEKIDTIEYEVIPKHGNRFLALDIGRLVEHDRYGKVFYVLILKEFDID